MTVTDRTVCPYCGVVLDKRPKRKKECPHCGNYIFLRRKPGCQDKVFVTESEAQAIDEENRRAARRDHWMTILGQFGVIQSDYERMKRQLRRRFKSEPADGDIIWGLLNKLTTELADLQDLRMLYGHQAHFLAWEGRDFLTPLRESYKCSLLHLKQAGCKSVRVCAMGPGQACQPCQQQDGRVLGIDAALREMPLPCRDCATEINGRQGFCRCQYEGVYQY